MSAPFQAVEPLRDAALELYRSGGLPRGDSTGWTALDELYTVGLGQWTVVTGVPGMGKSEFLDAMLVNLAERDGWRFAIYSPENHPTQTHVAKLAEKRARKPFNAGVTPRMSEREFVSARDWVTDHFAFMTPALKTPDELLETGSTRRFHCKKYGIVLDPWNTLEHRRNGLSETDYISEILSIVTSYCHVFNAHVWLVVHPQKLQRNRDGTRPVPTPYDLIGSSHWYNKAYNIICVHRDQAPEKPTQLVDIHVQKVKFKHVGHVGLVTLMYDKVTGRYFEGPQYPIEGEFYADPERNQAPPGDREADAAIQTE